jgi:hypothetical protein
VRRFPFASRASAPRDSARQEPGTLCRRFVIGTGSFRLNPSPLRGRRSPLGGGALSLYGLSQARSPSHQKELSPLSLRAISLCRRKGGFKGSALRFAGKGPPPVSTSFPDRCLSGPPLGAARSTDRSGSPAADAAVIAGSRQIRAGCYARRHPAVVDGILLPRITIIGSKERQAPCQPPRLDTSVRLHDHVLYRAVRAPPCGCGRSPRVSISRRMTIPRSSSRSS